MKRERDHLRETFRQAGRRLTHQRRLILEILQGSEDHLEAHELYAKVRSRDPDVSLATVYRTLSVLRELGLVEQHLLGEEHGHFEAAGENRHYHFTCLSCGKVIEFDSEAVEQVIQELRAQKGVRVTDAHLHLSGYCAHCPARERESSSLDEVRPT